jgi:A/G-specific adenine glycosylase
VYIHEFFHDREKVHDSQLIPLVERTMDAAAPRKWFNALMDYGAMLKRGGANPNRKSAHYTRQAAFENSNRQVRGRIVKVLVEESPLTIDGIVRKTGMDEERVREQIAKLTQEGFIRKQGRSFAIR